MAVLLALVLTYLFTTFFGYVVHWSLHQPWMGKLHTSHMAHHVELYPPEDFTSEVYRHPKNDNIVLVFGIASIPFVIIPIIVFILGIFPLSIFISIMSMMILQSFLHYYLHDAYHIKNHWLSKIPFVKDIFAKLYQLHYLHHLRMSKNFGIFVFHWDKVFGTKI